MLSPSRTARRVEISTRLKSYFKLAEPRAKTQLLSVNCPGLVAVTVIYLSKETPQISDRREYFRKETVEAFISEYQENIAKLRS